MGKQEIGDRGEGQERPPFLLFGNALWLDLVNTEIVAGGQRVDLLESFVDLIDWSVEAGAIGAEEARRVRQLGAKADGERALAAARRFRSFLRAIAEAAAAGRPIGRDALAEINAVLARPVHASEIRRTGAGFERLERWLFEAPDDLLVPVAESARDLLCGGDLSLVRKCRNPECILFFYDTTRNRARAWCSMSTCGNRTKVAAHYRRHHPESGKKPED